MADEKEIDPGQISDCRRTLQDCGTFEFRSVLGRLSCRLRQYKTTKKGRSHAREASEISFHSLRHSAVTMLKAAGVSDFIAREIVGHESAAVSRQYTHLTTDDKRAAMQRSPDVTDI
jgi:integrase